MKSLCRSCFTLLLVFLVATFGCSEAKKTSQPADKAATPKIDAATSAESAGKSDAAESQPSSEAPDNKSPMAGETEVVLLGSEELFTGIPGSNELSVDEIQEWLDDPKNHEVLKHELPLGMSAAAGQEKGLAENPLTRAKIELGRQLYIDPRLSNDTSISCASCHAPNQGFAAHEQFGVGVGGQKGGRNSPTAYNRILSDLQFWDGRAASLEEQAVGPIANPIEMGNTHEACVECIKAVPGYRIQFEKVFAEGDAPGEVNIDNVAKAIASFERALVTGPSPFDYHDQWTKRFKNMDAEVLEEAPHLKAQYERAKADVEAHPMLEPAIRGMEIFFSDKGGCSACHVGANLTDEKYHNIGVGMDKENPDVGRYEVTKEDADWGAFKTPTIRNVADTPPYMHDGSIATLKEVVEWYDKGGHPNKNLSDKIKKLNLTDQEKDDLVEFMKACSGPLPKINEKQMPK